MRIPVAYDRRDIPRPYPWARQVGVSTNTDHQPEFHLTALWHTHMTHLLVVHLHGVIYWFGLGNLT
jgi:hypothetical protein